jgi:hypothetical protein
VLTSANTPVHKLGQGELYYNLQLLFYDRGDMHRLAHEIEKVIKFQKELTNKEIWEN